MGLPVSPLVDTMPGFFARLPPLDDPRRTFDDASYRAAPDDWVLALTDIVGSTEAIAAGRHKTVNFVAAMAIAAARNLCAPEPIPFLFAGDGAVLMAPPQHRQALRQALARVRGTPGATTACSCVSAWCRWRPCAAWAASCAWRATNRRRATASVSLPAAASASSKTRSVAASGPNSAPWPKCPRCWTTVPRRT